MRWGVLHAGLYMQQMLPCWAGQALSQAPVQRDELQKERDILVRNISCLFKTAQLELQRKEEELRELRTGPGGGSMPLPPPPPPPLRHASGSNGIGTGPNAPPVSSVRC